MRRLAADRRAVDAHRGQRRMQVGSELEVAKTDDRELPGHRDAARLRLGQDAQREQVRAAEDGVDARRTRSSSASAARPLLRVVGAGTTTTATSGRPRACAAAWNACWRRRARSSPPAIIASRRRALGMEELGDRAADLVVREADQHVDRRRGQVPGLDHRDAGASSRLRPSAECMMPVSTMPSGRRPMIALEQRVLAEPT